jgi:hypothetical protein
MYPGKPAFAFTPHETALLMRSLGRNDIAATAFVADAEACLQAFDFAACGGLSSGLPQTVDEHLVRIVKAAAELRSALYSLPDDLAMLIDLHLLSDGARRRLAADFSQLVEPLEDIAAGVAEIRRAAAGDATRENARLEDRLVQALAGAFRNRLNRKPAADDDSGFLPLLGQLLGFAGQRLASVAAAAAALTPARLRSLLGESAKTEPADTA